MQQTDTLLIEYQVRVSGEPIADLIISDLGFRNPTRELYYTITTLTMKTGKTRTSLRQAEAKSRISQIDSPAGSSPPFEPQSVECNNNWMTNPDRAEERRIVGRMIEYLSDDQYIDDKIDILRFICREWTTYSTRMHIRTTIEAVKGKLLEMKVRYINCTLDGTWSYWTTYDDIMEFVPYSSDKSDRETTQMDQAELTDTSPPALIDTDITATYLMQLLLGETHVSKIDRRARGRPPTKKHMTSYKPQRMETQAMHPYHGPPVQETVRKRHNCWRTLWSISSRIRCLLTILMS